MKHSLINWVAVGLPTVFLTATAASAQAGLIAHYTFDVDGTATVGTDAVLGSAASIATEAVVGGGSLYLNGAPTIDTLGDDGAVSGNSFDWSTSDTRTVAFWMKATAGDHGDLLSTMISLGSGAGGGERFDIRTDGDVLRLEVQGGGTTTATVVADGTWRHIAVVATDPGTVANTEYYLDGVSQGTFGGSTTGLNTLMGPLRIGDSYHPGARDFKGHIDDVRLYDTALTASEIMALTLVTTGTPFCFGDGSDGVICPCGNYAVVGSDEGCLNVSGLGAYITASGAATVAADTLTLTIHQAAPTDFGIFVQNIALGAPMPFYNGGICLPIDSHLVRHYAPPVIQPTVTDAAGMGVNAQPMTAGDFLGDTQPGTTIHYQFWGRDNGGPCGTGANFSSGLSVPWS